MDEPHYAVIFQGSLSPKDLYSMLCLSCESCAQFAVQIELRTTQRLGCSKNCTAHKLRAIETCAYLGFVQCTHSKRMHFYCIVLCAHL